MDEMFSLLDHAASGFSPSDAEVQEALSKVVAAAEEGSVVPIGEAAARRHARRPGRSRRMKGIATAAAFAAAAVVVAVLLLVAQTALPPSHGGASKVLASGITPDGKYAFSLWRDGTRSFIRLPHDASQASISPDGRSIVFALPSKAPSPDQDIFDIRPGAKAPTEILGGPTFDLSPVWSPDGTRIAFLRLEGAVANAEGGMSCTPCTVALEVMDADGTAVRNLTPGLKGVSSSGFAWSHDGTRIAFTSNADGGDDIYVVYVDGPSGNATKVVDCDYSCVMPAWSPGDARLALILGAQAGHDERLQVAAMNADGSGLEQLSHDDTSYTSVEWSPDGSTLAMTGHDGATGNYDVYSIASTGGAAVRLTDKPGFDGDPHWIADGRLLFVSDRGGDKTLYVMDPDGSNQRPMDPRDGVLK